MNNEHEEISKAQRDHREDMEARNEVFRGLMFNWIGRRKLPTYIGVKAADPNDNAVPVRARMATYRFTASAINDL